MQANQESEGEAEGAKQRDNETHGEIYTPDNADVTLGRATCRARKLGSQALSP